MKKSLSAVLALVMILSCFTFIGGSVFAAEKLTITPTVASDSINVPLSNLGIEIDGNNQAIYSTQTLDDGTQTFRYTPNPAATKGADISSDGWNVSGLNVTDSYRYVEIVYYYTVPAGQTPASTSMVFRPLKKWEAAGLKTVSIVPNKWSTAVFDLGEAILGQGKFEQYHLLPLGGGKNGKNVPVDQVIDIASFKFYKQNPQSTITGGVAPFIPPVTLKAEDIVGEDNTVILSECSAVLVQEAQSFNLTADLATAHKYAAINYVAVGSGTGSIKLTIGDNGITATGFTTGAWKTAIIDISSVGASTAQTLTVTPADGQSIFVESVSFVGKAPAAAPEFTKVPVFDSEGEIIPTLDNVVKTGASLNDVIATGFNAEISSFVAGDALKSTPVAGAAEYSFDLPVAPFVSEWQPHIRVEYYLNGAGATFTGKPAIVVNDTTIEAAEDIVADTWAVATFDISSLPKSMVRSIKLLPFASNTVTAVNKLYLNGVVVSEKANTKLPSYVAPDLDDNGDVKAYAYTGDTQVAYYREGGTYTGTNPNGSTSVQPYGSLSAAVSALDKVGGGTLVLMSDIYLSNTDKTIDGHVYTAFPRHTNLIKIRGIETFRATVYMNAQSYLSGPTWFQKYIHFTNAPGSTGDTGIMLGGFKGIFGEEGGADDDITWQPTGAQFCIVGGGDGGTFGQVDLTFHSGQGPAQLRAIGAWGKGVINRDANLVINGGDFTNTTIKGMHGASGTETNSVIKGSYNITINGGKFGNNFADIAGSQDMWIKGDLNVTVNGGTFAKPLTVNSKIHMTGKKSINIMNAPATAINAATFDIIYKVTSEKSGETLAEAVSEVTAGTTATTSYGGTIKAVGEGITVSSDYTVPAPVAKLTFTGSKLKLADGITYTLGGDVEFKNIVVETGVDTRIVAGTHSLVFGEGASLIGPAKLFGSKITFADNIEIGAEEIFDGFAKNTATKIELDNFTLIAPSLNAVTTISQEIPATAVGGTINYYVTSLSSKKDIAGKMKVVDNTGAEQIIEGLKVNEWGAAAFDASVFANAAYLKVTPLFESELEEGFHLYIHSMTITNYANEYTIDFGDVDTDRFGEIIAPVDDITAPGINWYTNTSGRGFITVEQKPFSTGETAMLAPVAGGTPYVTYRLDREVNGEWQSFVKVEYYLHANADDVIPTDLKMAAKFGDNAIIEADRVITKNASAIAIFDISALPNNFREITLYPYSEDASAFDANNKIYMGGLKISTVKDTTVPEYTAPKLDEEGLIIPYSYNPGDGKAVVYVSAAGTYEGDYKGSKDSTKAYKTLEAAFAALKGVGGYVILCEDYNQYVSAGVGKNFPTHTDMIIVRGAEDEENPANKVTLNVSYMTSGAGPLTFENIKLNWVLGGNDDSLQMGNSLLVLGKEGVANDVILSRGNNTGSLPTITSTNLVVNGCKVGTIRTHTWIGSGTQSAASLNYTFNEHSAFGGITFGWGSPTGGSVTGDVNFTVNGGTATSAFRPIVPNGKITSLDIGGNYNVKISGGDFAALSDKSLSANTSVIKVKGTATIDILDYEGNSEVLLKKINQAGFNVLNINTIYVSSASGDDTRNGTTKATSVATLSKAIELLAKVPEGGNPNGKYSGRIVVLDYEVVEDEMVVSDSATDVVIVGEAGSVIKFNANADLVLNANTTFKSIKFEGAENACIFANGYKLVMGDGITSAGETHINIIGGAYEGTCDSVDITINSGEYDFVKGSIGDVKGGTRIIINGGTIHEVLQGGADNGNIGQDVYVEINGGKMAASSEIITGNFREGTEVRGDIVLKINDAAAVSAMSNGSIKPGHSDSVITTTMVDTSSLASKDNERIKNKLATEEWTDNGKIIEPKPDPEKFIGNVGTIWVFEEIVTQKNGLVKVPPLRIIQSAEQTLKPIVISPKQLNLKIDGGNQANMTIQMVSDDAVETIRFVPNHAATVGNAIAVDGWNINGRGLDLTKHKYAEIVYYYTVPEGQEMVAKKMTFRGLNNYNALGSVHSTELVANKWATAIIDFSSIVPEKGLSGDMKQYHFSPLDYQKGSAIPVDQYMDVVSLTFYSEKPSTTITGGKAPSAKIEAEEKNNDKKETTTVVAAPVAVPPAQLTSQVDKSGAFSGSVTVKEGENVAKIVPEKTSTKNVVIEGFAKIPVTPTTAGNTIDLRQYKYAILEYYYESASNTDPVRAPDLFLYTGGLAGDPNVVAGGKIDPATAYEGTELKANQWNYAVFDLTPKNPEKYKTKQYHLCPFGAVTGASIPEGDVVYMKSLTFYTSMPKLFASEEVVEDGVIEEVDDALTDADIEPKDPTVVAPSALRYYADTDKSFTGKMEVFEGKNVVAITPNTNVNKEIRIDGLDAVKADKGIISLKNYKYAVISYYFKSAGDLEVKAPEIELFSIGIKPEEGAIGDKTFKSGSSLKKNEWATATIRLNGTLKEYISKGFILKPFGSTQASAFAKGDVLYIESVQFVTEVQ